MINCDKHLFNVFIVDATHSFNGHSFFSVQFGNAGRIKSDY